MPLYTVKEFSELTGIPPKNIHTYANPSRGKIIKTKDKRIDTANPINAAFLAKHKKSSTTISEPKAIRKEKPKKINGRAQTKNTDNGKAEGVASFVEEKTRVELEIKKKDLEKKELELKKLSGELINAQQAKDIARNYSEVLQKSIVELMQTHIQDICARHGIDSGKAGKYKLRVVELLNTSNDLSIQELTNKF